jgi:hypothetical protein
MKSFQEGVLASLSILSTVCSATIILAYALVPAVRTRKYFEALFYIGISNFFTSFANSFGFVRDDSPECWVQGIVTNVFAVSSIAWTVVVSLILNHAVTRAVMLEITPLMHLICWGLPVIVTFIPLSEVSFGSKGGQNLCFFETPDFFKLVLWRWIGFYVWIMLGVVIIIFLFINMFCKKTNMITEKAFLKKLFHKLKYYPVTIVVCWLPVAVFDSVPDNSAWFYTSTNALSCFHGTLLAIVFWVQNYQVLREIKGRRSSRWSDRIKIPDHYKTSSAANSRAPATFNSHVTSLALSTVATTIELPRDSNSSFVSNADEEPRGSHPTKNPLIIDSHESP